MKLLANPDCKQEIHARLQNLRPNTPRRWGRMSAPQMVCHLRESFLGVMGDKPMTSSGFTLWRLTKPFALYSPFQWPHGVPTRPEFDQLASSATPPAEFAADLLTLRAAIDKFTQQPRAFHFRPHPLFGNLSEWEWMRWAWLHLDHHLRQFGE